MKKKTYILTDGEDVYAEQELTDTQVNNLNHSAQTKSNGEFYWTEKKSIPTERSYNEH